MRVDGWETRLMEAVQKHDELPFEWGYSDCLTLIGDVVRALTDEDPMEAHRGAYSTEEEAQELLEELGFVDTTEALASLYEEIPPAMARRGDVGVVVVKGVAASVVVMGSILIGKSHQGAIKMSATRLTRAFKIG